MRLAAIMLAFAATVAPAAAGEMANAHIKLFQFQPKEIGVKAGTTVTWENGDDIQHSVTAGMPGKKAKDFDSGFFAKGERFEHTFAEPGTFTYFCMRHPSMSGKIVVTP